MAAVLILVLILFLTGRASYGIANVVHKMLVKADNPNAIQ
ncbi:hypothetical protein Niako_6397 [Niastella koreensis GR20-10]|uniref:Uncharacterized protein n=1 Tax=Niastella koreensis (strain DSM 17620 / KACC 11465 / NBRC 106392 / GR20-10) TaxID=700598 RepID=G8TDY7_NIAKG|nr:hypothetical protein Niako_6397 [Niastella koreensis GR20-10]